MDSPLYVLSLGGEKDEWEREILIQRATPLVVGLFGQAERAPDQREVHFGRPGLFKVVEW
jgi:hypothetical protein